MPLNVKRFVCSVLLLFTFSVFIVAQTTADVMRERVAQAKAHIAVRNFGAAIYELENIRRETNDPTVHNVINVLLINSFLGQGDYKRAQDFLAELAKKSGASASYFAAASQVVKEAKNQMERYRSLGLSVSDPKLPNDAVADVDKMRETLEKVVEQTKILSKDKTQTSNAMALMEEATVARGGLARDDFDANRWKNEAADAREDLANSRSVIINAVNETPGQTTEQSNTDLMAKNTTPNNSSTNNSTTNNPAKTNETTPTLKPVPESTEKITVAKNDPIPTSPVIETTKQEVKKIEETSTLTKETSPENETKQSRTRRVENNDAQTNTAQKENKIEPQPIIIKDTSPLEVGSLVGYATQKTNPVYPPMAKNMRMTGVVKVELMIDEKGQVAEVQNTSGPVMLQRAATDAIKKWKFKPFTRDGQATKATGFVSFNFSL